MCRPKTPRQCLPPDRLARRTTEQKEGQCPPPTNGINGEAFGYLKRVIVTPAVYQRLVEFLHFDIQSRRAEITLREHPRGPSQCFVLIKRSGFPLSVPVLSRLFGAGEGPQRGVPDPSPARRGDQLSPGGERFEQSTDSPAGWGLGPRAQPSSQSFFPKFWIHFADFPCLHCVGGTFGPPVFKGARAAGHHRRRRCSSSRWTLPPAEPFQGGQAVKQKDNSSEAPPGVSGLPNVAVNRRPICTGGAPPGLSRPRFCGNRQPSLDRGLAVARRRVFAPIPKSGERFAASVSLRASTSFLGRPRSGIVHHLWVPTGMLTLEPFSEDLGGSAVQPARDPANQLPCALRVWWPAGFAHMSDSLVRVSRRVEWGTQLARRQSARRCHENASVVVARHPPRSARRRIRGGIIRRAWPWAGIYRPIWAAFPNNPTSPTSASRSRRGPGTTGLSPSLAPIPWDLRPVRREGRLLRTTIERRKPLDSHLGLFRLSSPVTRGILRVFPPDLGCQSEQGLRSAGGNCRRGGPLEPGPRTDLSPRGGGGREPPLSSCEVPLGQSVFSQPAPGGRATNLLRPGDPPARQRWGSRARGGENCVGRGLEQVTVFVGRVDHVGPPRASSLNSTDRARVVVRCVRVPDRRGRAGAETRRRPVSETLARRDRRAFTHPAAPVAQRGIVCSFVKQVALRLVESTMILPRGSVDFSIALSAANRQRRPRSNTSRTIQSVGSGGRTEAATRPVKARAHRPVEGASRTCAHPRRTDRPTQGPTSELFNCNNLNIAIGAGITAAAGTGLALNGSSLKGFRLYSFQLPDSRAGIVIYCHYLPCRDWVISWPAAFLGCGSRFSGSLSESNPNSPSPVNTMDQPGSILSRRGASTSTAPDRESPSTPGGGHRRSSKKLKRSDFVCESTKSIGTAAFTWVHEHFRRPAFEHTSVRLSGGKNSGAPIAPARTPPRPGSGGGFQRDYTSKHQGNASDPTRPHGEVRLMKGRQARTTAAAHLAESTTQRVCPTCTTSPQRPSRPPPDARPVHGETNKGAIKRPPEQVKIGRGGTERSRERERSKNFELGKRVADPTWAFPCLREELKAIAHERGANGLCTALTLRGKPLPEALGGNKPLPRP
ncbi:hypothetical protein H6P81_021242 [Aristolochia fimbriata]|uniref:Uncharacterized protein n=1 Tax=Aristolochia fimbriata TaxID=158543 RepID=A0AAV7DU70_ARIFI|nr:hypothetical protein H6P81_021242 [Aristolochia fimbriata]